MGKRKVYLLLLMVFFLMAVMFSGCGQKQNESVSVSSTAAPTSTPRVVSASKPTATPIVKPTATPTVKPTVKPTVAPTVKPTSTPITTPNKVQPSDAAKTAANSDDTGAPYFITYDYDATNYLVSAYENQQGPGNYTGGSSLYLINKSTGKVLANTQIDLSKVDFSKYLTVYSKLSGKIIE